jgi:hypothetical protein
LDPKRCDDIRDAFVRKKFRSKPRQFTALPRADCLLIADVPGQNRPLEILRWIPAAIIWSSPQGYWLSCKPLHNRR